ncbi:hypothetical protein E1B28_011094 [Marasmius oreades]|uniref:DUF7582 domain-containing protein n=1 Tax=Marasmius oreades TaxID=181124 RepID=A0A9P7RUE8_9AGAR|nr:uncharacterized protein E1B28_011094 [Marasmius oreades]KAG7089406.1 hypothetical protein E1B28_011094 [Marasmius oreades]
MGNCFSSNDPISLADLAARPDGPPEVQMTADMIRQGLTNVANTLNSKKRNISIIAVGGAVNTLLLHTRETTGDVDFFYRTKEKHEDVSKIIVAADAAASKLGLGDQWLNNHTAVFIEVGVIQRLYDEAVEQNEVVFKAPGLVVYAAPWRYALGTKLDRLSKKGFKPYDMSDAVGYLVRLIQKHGGKAVKKSELKAWAQEFKFTVPSDQLMASLGAEYKKKAGKDGVIDG